MLEAIQHHDAIDRDVCRIAVSRTQQETLRTCRCESQLLRNHAYMILS